MHGKLFEDQRVPEPGRIGGYRAISKGMFPQIEKELRERGWLRMDELVTA
jgi:hypothetical protein